MDPTTKLLIGATLGMTGVMAALVILIAVPARDREETRQIDPCTERGWLCPFVCSEEDVEETCPDRMYCDNSHCQLESSQETCKDGQVTDEAGGCRCPGNWKTDTDRRCVRALAKPKGDVCKDVQALERVRKLYHVCKLNDARVEQQNAANGGTCTAANFEQYALEHPEEFDQLLADFPDHMAILFENAKPGKIEDAGTWKRTSGDQEKHIEESLIRYKDSLEQAKHIMIVSRASKTGHTKDNNSYGMARLIYTQDRLVSLLGKESVVDKLLKFTLSEERPITADNFIQYYGKDFIASSKQREREFAEKFAGTPDRRLKSAVNRVVFIIPIPCDINGPQAVTTVATGVTP